jgi:hypothetical protein
LRIGAIYDTAKVLDVYKKTKDTMKRKEKKKERKKGRKNEKIKKGRKKERTKKERKKYRCTSTVLWLYKNHRQNLAFLFIKNDGADIVCDGPGKHKHNFTKILSQESLR